MDYTIRELKQSEYPLLTNFLYEAIFIPDGATPPPKSILISPELQVYVANFGTQQADKALVAEMNATIVGAVWVRIMKDYGHIDDKTPSLAIALYKEYRGLGIGTALLSTMLALLKKSGCVRVSLAVQKANYAFTMHQKAGFEIVRETGEEYIMACLL